MIGLLLILIELDTKVFLNSRVPLDATLKKYIANNGNYKLN